MKTTQRIFFIVIIIMSFNCGPTNTANHKKADSAIIDSNIRHQAKTAKEVALPRDTFRYFSLAYGFKIKAGNKITSHIDFETCDILELYHNGLKIFTDTVNGYKLFQKPYPILNKIMPGVFEFSLNFYNNPSKDLATFLRIEDDKIVKNELLPSFDGKPQIINGLLTYHTIWDYGEVWGENEHSYTTYNPDLYYQFTPDGLKLDTPLTALHSKMKYGRFDGVTYNGIIGYPSDSRGNITDTTAKNVLRKPLNNKELQH